MYTKKFKTFMQGIDELCNISYSIRDSLSASHYDPVRTLNRAAIEWGLRKNITDGEKYNPQSCPHGEIYDTYVKYTTTGDVEYGWNEEDNDFRFYIDFREGSIYKNAKQLGWTWRHHSLVFGDTTQNRIEEYQQKLDREKRFEVLKHVYEHVTDVDSLKTYKESYKIENNKVFQNLLDLENMEFPCFVELEEIYVSDWTVKKLYLIYKPLKTNSLFNKYIGFDQGKLLGSEVISDEYYYQQDPSGFLNQEDFIKEFKKYKPFFDFMYNRIKDQVIDEMKKQVVPFEVLLDTPISKLTDFQIDIIHNNLDIAIVNDKVTLYDGEKTITKEANPEDTLSGLFSEIN